jgi:hypothetical protein
MSREELCKLCESPILCRPGVSMKILKAPDRSAAAAAARVRKRLYGSQSFFYAQLSLEIDV